MSSQSDRLFYITFITHVVQPVKIICTATAVTIYPVIRINGSAACIFSIDLFICKESNIKNKLIITAILMQIDVTPIPFIEAKEMAAVIVPGPAISGAARGTIDISRNLSASSPASINLPFLTAFSPTRKRIIPPATLNE